MMDEVREQTQPQADPREVVDWYVPRQGSEVVDYYVHHRPLPEGVRPVPPCPPRRKKRLGLWIFLGVMGLVAVIMVVAALLWRNAGYVPDDGSDAFPDQGDHDASSIVDIFAGQRTTIPPVDSYDPSVKMTITDTLGEELTAQQVYAKVNPATVLVVAQNGSSASVGTGVIMTSDGYVITNAHVISGGEECWVALSNGVTYDTELVGYDTDEDIAVLKLADAEGLPTAEFGNSDLAEVGDHVYAIGNPLGIELRGTLTEGLLSAVNRDVKLEGRTLNVLQTTAALNNGNSGGPLINRYGQVIGINTLKMSGTGGAEEAAVEGLGFALPICSVYFVVNDIIANGKFYGTPTLGLMVATYELEDGGTAAVIEYVTEGTSAEEAGAQAGDVITAVDGREVFSTADVLAARRAHVIGDTMTLTLLRDGQTFDVSVVLRANQNG